MPAIGAFGLIGLLLAAVGIYGVQGMLFGISARDLTTFIAVPVRLGAVALLASYIPARRATRIDPIVVLRTE